MFGKPQDQNSGPGGPAGPRPGGPQAGPGGPAGLRPGPGGPAGPRPTAPRPGGPQVGLGAPQGGPAGPRPGPGGFSSGGMGPGGAPRPGGAPAPRRSGPSAAPRPVGGERGAALGGQQDNGRLTVGQEIKMSGEIKSCDRLVVEGTVEASLTDSRALEVTETGIFRGSAEIDMADINGVFEGELNVEGRLFIRAQGRVSGTVRYGELEIERGGRISGEVGNQSDMAQNVGGYRRPYDGDDSL